MLAGMFALEVRKIAREKESSMKPAATMKPGKHKRKTWMNRFASLEI
jgi:hypothetical protein